MRDKLALTQTLISQIPSEDKPTLDSAMRSWWVNLRKAGGMRLTTEGYTWFRNVANLECYKMEINIQTFSKQLVLDLDRKLLMPYYIEIQKRIPANIIFFGSREAMLARLYGDLERFLANY